MDFLEIGLSLLTLSLLEIVLGIDNIIFISIVANKLPKHQQGKARNLGLVLALLVRILMLIGIKWLISFNAPLFSLLEHSFTGRDLILLAGGIFLLAKTTTEIHHKVSHPDPEDSKTAKKQYSLKSAIVQIILLDVVFSFDSILTAIGMVEQIWIMVSAILISMVVMLIFAKKIADFISKNPAIQMLALSFLILIGVMLIAEGFGKHVEKAYIYSAVGFSLLVELLNMRRSKVRKHIR